jgi:chaperonin GroEL
MLLTTEAAIYDAKSEDEGISAPDMGGMGGMGGMPGMM